MTLVIAALVTAALLRNFKKEQVSAEFGYQLMVVHPFLDYLDSHSR